MSDNTKIEWTTHSFNPWWGCSRVSPGCRFCYADRDAQRYGHQLWRRHGERRMLSDNAWRRPLKWNREAREAGVPVRVFCASMADVFEDHPDVSEARERLWNLIEDTPFLTWQLLTKRPENIGQMVPWGKPGHDWPRNVWMGTSTESQPWADRRIPLLVEHARAASVLFVSAEPLLGPLDLSRWLLPEADGCNCGAGPSGYYGMHERHCGLEHPLLDWVIGGGESGPKARVPDPQWFRSLRDQCRSAGAAYLFKQWGEWAPAGVAAGYVSDPRERLIGDVLDEHGCRALMRRVGKKSAGRQLDGRTWDEFPQVSGAVAA